MTLTFDSPATIFDMAELGGARTAVHWAVLKEMHSNGRTWAARADGRLIALAGIYEAEGFREAWFNPSPAAARHMRGLMRFARLTLAGLGYPEILVICGTEAGRRMASISGFRFADNSELGEIWRHGCTFRERSGSAEKADAVTTAPPAGGHGPAAG